MKSKSYSRRSFLKAATVGTLGLGTFAFSSPALGDIARSGVYCKQCQAHLVRGNVFQGKTYCPNCGVDMNAPNGTNVWNGAQVPFPNRHLVRSSSKPKVLYADIFYKRE